MSFSYNIENINDKLTVISFTGRLMHAEDNEAIIKEVEEKIANGGSAFILDLEKLDYMNSSGLNVFVSILTKARNNGGDVIICSVPEKINQLLIITKLNSVFTVTKSVKEAVNKLSETTEV